MPESRWDSRPRTVLVTEDDAFVGFDLTDVLEEAGYRIAGPVNSSTDALNWLKANVPDIVVLDVMLRDGSCIDIARELRRRQIPFLIYSGRRQHQAPIEFQDVRWLEKPASHADLLSAVAQLLGSACG
jgi:DNA-binding response OmpR family regulator